MVSEPVTLAVVRPWPVVTKETSWRLLTSTVGACFRYRVTGLAAEAAFFAILSLPPLVFGLAGSITYIIKQVDPTQISYFKSQVVDMSGQVLTEQSVNRIVVPTVDRVLQGGRFDVISIGFVLALWSGSRALNVFVDTITIMYGLGGRRGIVRTPCWRSGCTPADSSSGSWCCRWCWPGRGWSTRWFRNASTSSTRCTGRSSWC